MNPYASDTHETPEATAEQLPPGLSGATILATIIMLVFGLSALSSIFGVIVGLIQFAATPADAAAQPSDTSISGAMPFQPTPTQIVVQSVVGVLDFALGIFMVLWSIQVLQRKRPAALKLSGLALVMAILEIPRGLISYLFLPQIMESVKKGMIQGMEQQAKGEQQPPKADIDSIFQVVTYGLIGCSAALLVALFFTYLFCYFQLRKPTTLARLSP